MVTHYRKKTNIYVLFVENTKIQKNKKKRKKRSQGITKFSFVSFFELRKYLHTLPSSSLDP